MSRDKERISNLIIYIREQYENGVYKVIIGIILYYTK